MAMLRVVVWTLAVFGLGVAAGVMEIAGKTPWQHARGLFRSPGARLEKLKGGAAEVVEDVKFRLAPGEGQGGPRERHSKAEREAVEQIIAKRGQR